MRNLRLRGAPAARLGVAAVICLLAAQAAPSLLATPAPPPLPADVGLPRAAAMPAPLPRPPPAPAGR